MKNILVSAYACMPRRGSEEGNGWHYSSLISQHHRVWCLTRVIGKDSIDQMMQQSPNPNLTFVYVTVPYWVDKAYFKGLIGMYFHYLYWQWETMKTARTLHQQHRFDLIHHVSYGSLQLGSFLYKLNIPFIFGPIGGGQEAPYSMRHYFKKYWWKEQMRSVISSLLLHLNPGCYQSVRRASYVLVWNEDTRKMVESMGRTKAVVKEFGGVAQAFIPAEPLIREPGAILELVWVARLMPRKALELTLHALSKVDAAVPVHLTVVGDGEMGHYVPDYITTYNLENRVTWVGHVTFDEVRSYYRKADVFFFTSLRDTGPIQLLEAMAYTLPVITLNIHGQAELVSDATGIRVPISDPETVTSELARAVEWMFHNPDKRTTMGINAYKFASQQTWERKITRLVRTYYRASDTERVKAR